MIRNRWRGKFIDIEGLDGSGKTTTLSLLASRTSAESYDFIKGVGGNNFWGRLAKKYATMLLFAWEVLVVSAFQVWPALRAGRIVIMDKYFFAVASHIPNVEKYVNRLVLDFCRRFIIQPDLVVYMEVGLKERLERLKKASDNKFHQMLLRDPVWLSRREKAYCREVDYSGVQVIHLDNTNFTTEQTSEKLEVIIRKFLQEGTNGK